MSLLGVGAYHYLSLLHCVHSCTTILHTHQQGQSWADDVEAASKDTTTTATNGVFIVLSFQINQSHIEIATTHIHAGAPSISSTSTAAPPSSDAPPGLEPPPGFEALTAQVASVTVCHHYVAPWCNIHVQHPRTSSTCTSTTHWTSRQHVFIILCTPYTLPPSFSPTTIPFLFGWYPPVHTRLLSPK